MEHQCDLLSPVLTNIQPNYPNSLPRSLPAQHGLMPMADPNEGLKKQADNWFTFTRGAQKYHILWHVDYAISTAL